MRKTMADKEKQIEEMAKYINIFQPTFWSDCLKAAQYLIEKQGYRKITDDLIVLNKDEYNNLIKPTLKSIEAAIAKFAEQEAKKKLLNWQKHTILMWRRMNGK